jgi:hypothetical protein
MKYSLLSWCFVAVAGLVLALAGCQSKTGDKQPEKKAIETRKLSETSEKAKATTEPKLVKEANSEPLSEVKQKPITDPPPKKAVSAAKSKPKVDLPPPAIREVALSDKLRATCVVNVGQAFSQGELVDLEGKTQSLETLLDQKPTVVCFWSIGASRAAQLRSIGLLQDLEQEIAEPFKSQGLSVVCIDVGDQTKDVQKHLADAGVSFPCLLDPQGKYYAKIATDREMPRVFMVDAGGRILWFDLEFSRTARREFIQNLHVLLDKKK